MRRILLASVLFPACAFADQIPATSHITEVTIYAQGARVVREVTFDAPAGTHDLTLDDLPPEIADGAGMRILPGPGVTVGAYALTADGIPTGEPRRSNAQTAADTRVKTLEADERTALAAIDTINTRIEAVEAQAGFLRTLGTGDNGIGSATPQALQDMAAMIGTQTAQIATTRAAALAERRQAEADLAHLQADLAAAREALATLTSGGPETATVLRLSLATATGGPGTLQVAYYIGNATWSPVYDIDLARKDGRMTVERGVVVQQATGEDWTDVNLTLSTARPGEQSAPSTLYADLRRIEPEVQIEARGASDTMMAGAPAMVAEGMMPPGVNGFLSAANAMFIGDTVVYRYALPVTLSSGVESLRLSLGNVDLAPEIRAIAVPRLDHTAYLQATATNTTDEILLPGQTMLLRDGALIGTMDLDTIAPGVEFTLPFGPIEGLRLSRTLPVRAEGETGILSTSSQIEESATLKIENKTTEAWDVRVLDQVPYSEQEDLEITYTATPEPTETRVEGVRGHLAWDMSLPPGETREIKLDHVISWPEGMVLQ
jgi:uncharacterized protein (TIGR02231 family)